MQLDEIQEYLQHLHSRAADDYTRNPSEGNKAELRILEQVIEKLSDWSAMETLLGALEDGGAEENGDSGYVPTADDVDDSAFQ